VCRRATAAFRIGGGGAVSAAFEDAGRCDIDRFTRRKAARAPSKNRSLFVYIYFALLLSVEISCFLSATRVQLAV